MGRRGYSPLREWPVKWDGTSVKNLNIRYILFKGDRGISFLHLEKGYYNNIQQITSLELCNDNINTLSIHLMMYGLSFT